MEISNLEDYVRDLYRFLVVSETFRPDFINSITRDLLSQ